MRILPRAGLREDSPQPIFIVGFPRSGTTLVEQTLSAHPRISAGDELPFINEITDSMVRTLNSPMGYPEAMAELWMGDRRYGLDELRDRYLEQVRRLDIVEPGAAWFTDKMPLNETHLGLIALVFPQAPIIHVVRHPLDIVAVGVFQQFDPRFSVRVCARNRGVALPADHGAGRALPSRVDPALSADPLRGYCRRPGG
jgi:hypothetical protein